MSVRSPVQTPNTSTTFLPGPSSGPSSSATAPLFPSADPSTTPTPISSSFSSRVPIPAALRKGQLVHHDNDCLVFREEERALASQGHLTFLVQPALSSIYEFSPASVPLLARLHALAQTLLAEHFPNSYRPATQASAEAGAPAQQPKVEQKIGFVTSPFKDPLNGGHPHLTLHALLGPLDKASFYSRSFPFGPLGFYTIEDLIAEIRESSSNNRIRSSHPPSSIASSRPRPLTTALDAGSRSGLPNGLEITPSGELISHPTPSDPPLHPRRSERLDSLASASSAGSASSSAGLVVDRERVLMGDVPEGSKRKQRGKGKEAEVVLGEEIDLAELAKRDVDETTGEKLV